MSNFLEQELEDINQKLLNAWGERDVIILSRNKFKIERDIEREKVNQLQQELDKKNRILENAKTYLKENALYDEERDSFNNDLRRYACKGLLDALNGKVVPSKVSHYKIIVR